jgi:hypothetical protein
MIFVLSLLAGFASLPVASLLQLVPLPLWHLALLPLLAIGGCSSARTDSGAVTAQWIGGADTARVTVVGLEMDEFMHAEVTRGGQSELYRLAPADGLDLFLAMNAGSSAVLRLESRRVFLPESGGTDTVAMVTSAAAGGTSFEEWVSRQTGDSLPVDSLYSIHDQVYLEALGRR